MSPLADHVPSNQDSLQNFWQGSWPSIVRIIIVEILLLLALAFALVYYLNWSSDAAVSEFMATGSLTLHTVKDHPPRGRSA
jgi:LPS O-antigen subunit length determinant protein (WzzB/FepE family)